MKGYLFSLTAAALLSALVLALVPEGSVRRTVQLGCGLLLALTALSPLLKLDYDAIAKQIAEIRLDTETVRTGVEVQNRELQARIISEQAAAYIWDKADEMGVALEVEVEGSWQRAISVARDADRGVRRRKTHGADTVHRGKSGDPGGEAGMAMRIDREALGRAGRTLRTFAAKYRIAILAALLGLLLLLWPTGSRRETVKTETAASGFSLAETEEKLEALLCQIDGAGAVDVMLTLADGGEAVYQVDETVRDGGREEQTVLADKAPVLVQTRQPRFQGAVVVCEGADRAAVKLAVTEAVASLTGLGSGKIAVVKMKSSN